MTSDRQIITATKLVAFFMVKVNTNVVLDQ